MKKLIYLLSILTFSCIGPIKKEYKYYEIVQNRLEGPKIIEAENDSSAYITAFQNFRISYYVSLRLSQETGSNFNKPDTFKIIDSEGKNITHIKFKDIDSIKAAIEERIYNSTYKEFEAELKVRQRNDSIKAKKAETLKKYFTFKKDEFDQSKRTWVKPKDAPAYSNRNGFYCYFQIVNGRASNLRLKIQYCSEDWLFIQKYVLSSGDELYEFTPSEIERDCGNGKIWEWTDEIVRSYSTYPALKAISEKGGGKIKMDGKQYHKVKEITKAQAISVKRTLELYEALGGEI